LNPTPIKERIPNMDIENPANAYKEKGNDAFKLGDYPAAIEYFSKAIVSTRKISPNYHPSIFKRTLGR
jgi:tetratricopeptide (TPR) repeat protein